MAPKGHLRRAVMNDAHFLKLQIRSLSPGKKGLLFLFVASVLVIIYHLLVYLVFTDLGYKTDAEKCPACFGERMCGKISETKVHGLQKFHIADRLTNVKNVYSGHVKDLNMILKKLAHDDELNQVDNLICDGRLSICPQSADRKMEDCRDAPIPLNCDFKQAVQLVMKQREGPVTVDDVRKLSDATHCPSQRLVKRIVDRYQEVGGLRHEDGLSPEEKMRLLYTLAVNAEPIVLQTFPGGEGWPFPRYIGACGRMIAEEDVGESLQNYFKSDWLTRIGFSIQILQIADHLTDNASGFKLYFSDIHLDNYVVDARGKLRIADTEDVLVVDEQELTLSKPEGWNVPFYQDIKACNTTGCLVINQDYLCQTTKSDFNYFAVCKILLASNHSTDDHGGEKGLLHSLPSDLNEKDAIISMANQCADPPSGVLRELVKEKLLNTLRQVYEREKKAHKPLFDFNFQTFSL